jgi:hypothetical protein
MFLQAVPQCDLADVQIDRFTVPGDAYNWYTALQCFAVAECGSDEDMAKCRWPRVADREPYYTDEAQDRARALHERKKLKTAIVNSPYHSAWSTPCGLVIGVAWNINVYYVTDGTAIQISADVRTVIDAVLAGVDATVELEQRMYHSVAHEELKLHFAV